MTVNSSVASEKYDGDGASVAFPIPFYFLDDSHIAATTFIVSTGAPTALVLGTDYTVSGAGIQTGGTLTLAVALPVGSSLFLVRNVPIDQQIDYTPNDKFPAEVTESGFDKLTMICQQLNAGSTRNVRYADYENIDGQLPAPLERANTLLGWSENGTPTYYPLPSNLGAGDLRFDTFVAGVDFTPDVTTKLTLSRAPINKGNCWVYWGATPQLDFSVTDLELDFPTPIPSGVPIVYVRVGTTLSLGVPAQGSVGDDQLVWGSGQQKQFDSIAALRANSDPRYVRAHVTSYSGAPFSSPHGGGNYAINTVATADDGGWNIVDALGRTWTLCNSKSVSPATFGAPLNGTDDDAPAIRLACAYAIAKNVSVDFGIERHTINTPLVFIDAIPSMEMAAGGQLTKNYLAGPAIEISVRTQSVTLKKFKGLNLVCAVVGRDPTNVAFLISGTDAGGVSGTDPTYFQYNKFIDNTATGFFAYFKVTKDPQLNGSQFGGNVDWNEWQNTLILNGANFAIKGWWFTLGSGTGNQWAVTTIATCNDSENALWHFEGNDCIVGDIVIEGVHPLSQSGTGAVGLKIGDNTVYRSRISITGQFDAAIDNPIVLSSIGTEPYNNILLNGCNIGGSVDMSSNMPAIQASRIDDQSVSEWRAGKQATGIAAGTHGISIFAVTLGAQSGTMVDIEVAGLVAGVSAGIFRERFLVSSDNSTATVNGVNSDALPGAVAGFYTLSTSISGLTVTFVLNFVSAGAGSNFDAQIKAVCGSFKVKRFP